MKFVISVKKIFYYFCILALIPLLSCKRYRNPDCNGKWDERLLFKNNTLNNLYIVHSSGYPDTNSLNIINHKEYRVGYCSKQSSDNIIELCSWDEYIKMKCKGGKLMIFLLLDEGQGREKILKQHTLIKRFDFTLDELKGKSWLIEYP